MRKRYVPARMRPRWYEALRSEPHRAATLIAGSAATTKDSISVFLFSRNESGIYLYEKEEEGFYVI